MSKREQRRRERRMKRLGYRPLTAAEQALLILRLWIRNPKGGRR